MTKAKIIPLLLAGGAGARLWPVSGDSMPKQFLPLLGARSTYQQALARVSGSDLFGKPIVMTSDEFRFFALTQAEALGIDNPIVLLEVIEAQTGSYLSEDDIVRLEAVYMRT